MFLNDQRFFPASLLCRDAALKSHEKAGNINAINPFSASIFTRDAALPGHDKVAIIMQFNCYLV